MRILITGAGGYLGIQLCKRLTQEGHFVRAITHSGLNNELAQVKGLEQVIGDVCDRDFLEQVMSGIDQVYHVAAFARSWAIDPRIFYRVNVGGTVNLLETARRHNVSRIVVTSTAGTIGPVPAGKKVVSEDQVRETRFFGDYEMSKFIADERIQHYVREGMDIRIVCPTRIFGPGNTKNMGGSLTRVLKKYARGGWRIQLGGHDVGNYVYIEDAVQGHILAMERGEPGEKYLIGSFNDSIGGLFKTIDEIQGRSYFTFKVPVFLLKVYAVMMRGLGELFRFDPIVTVDWVEKIDLNWSADSEKAKTKLGYIPTDKITALKATIERQ